MQPHLLVSGDFVKTGGMDRANYALADHLARSGCEVHLVAFRVASELAATPGVVVHRVPKPLGSYTLALPLLDRVGRKVAARLARAGGRVIVNGGSCQWGDVNWVHFVHAAHVPRVRRGLIRRIAATWNHRKWLDEERRAVTAARVVLTNSERTRRDVIELLGAAPERVRRVYYGTDPDLFRPTSPAERARLRETLGWAIDRPVAVFVGAMSDRRKGFDVVMAAWEQLCLRPDWDVDLVVIGAGAEVPAWQARSERAGLGGRVRFLGLRSDVADLFRAADVLVSPTRYEAYGLAVHEALCCGIPALVTETAGVAERYPDEMRALLLPEGHDVARLAAALLDWRQRAFEYGSAALGLSAQLRNRTWDDMARQMVAEAESVGPTKRANT